MRKLLKFCCNVLYRISPSFYYGLRYYHTRKRWPNLKRPHDFSEYLLSGMLQPSFARYADYADKVKVRDYIETKGLGELLPSLYGVWKDARDIDFVRLPQKFALKTNHGCGNHIICTDKNALDTKRIVSSINSLLKRPYSIREPHYRFIDPKAYAEELLEVPDGGPLIDYKFMCSKGRVMCILTCTDRDENFEHPALASFDTDWNLIDWIPVKDQTKIPVRPPRLKEMTVIAEKIAADFDFVRVDLYNIGERIIFGELTFTPASGLMSYFTDDALVELAKPLVTCRN